MFVIRSFSLLCRRSAVSTWRNKSQSAGKRLDIIGIYPPIATPFTQSEDVDYQRLDDNLKKYANLPFRGGPFNFLTNAQMQQKPQGHVMNVKHTTFNMCYMYCNIDFV